MRVRVGHFARAAFGAALAVLAGAFANAQTAVPGQDEMNIADQPGYQPSPDEEQLTGAFEKQEVFFRGNEAAVRSSSTRSSVSFTCCRGTTGPFATASAWAAKASSGPACNAFRASRSGR